MRHLKRDYRTAPGVLALGVIDPKPIVHGAELMVEGADGVCISMSEAMTPFIGLDTYDPEKISDSTLWIPTLNDIETLKVEARKLYSESNGGQGRRGGSPTGHTRIPKDEMNQYHVPIYETPPGWRSY